MEVVLKRSVIGGFVKEEKSDYEEGREIVKMRSEVKVDEDNSSNPKDSAISRQIPAERSSPDARSTPSSSNDKDSLSITQENQLESAKAEMGEVREENERLKLVLARIVKDYHSLQMHFYDIVQQEQAKKSFETVSTDQEIDEPELVSLSLGTNSSGQKKEEMIGNCNKGKEDEQLDEGLTLGLDCKFEGSNCVPIQASPNPSPENSFEEAKEEEVGEPWPPSKILKTMRSGDDEVSQQAHVKKARVSVRARCETPTMNDGCQWRKYGQKIAKGNPCPRAYYRCTVAPSCPVRKQVQRCAEDMGILITTYEGNHNHPLPISATAMASTTSAAACMIMSGSSSSRQAMGAPATTIPTSASDLHGLNFNLSDNPRPRPFYMHNPSISSSSSCPTITLDLTAPSSSSSQSSQFNRFSPNFSSSPRYSSTSLNFSNSDPLQTPWNNGYLSYGAQQRPSQVPFFQPYLQKTNPAALPQSQQSLTDTIAAATKVITSDPSFRSALAAAITSVVGGSGGAGGGNGVQGGGENVGHSLKWGEPFNGCSTSYLNRSSPSNPQQGNNFMLLPPPLAFSSSKSAAASPVDHRDHVN